MMSLKDINRSGRSRKKKKKKKKKLSNDFTNNRRYWELIHEAEDRKSRNEHKEEIKVIFYK